ncbi:response regulator [Mucilaginibacter paludis]|uniref:Response regulator receiver protein n=1 Tax=Mucilaginibacter paludis DSM 18603 TaxID=714943 RepID=H1Y840_9SPHI|nr:response regulator [Mucilaginibacter paludis]EHQ31062.1 response regulator receiver protein [Mucilaginibacter paludis DSM 18603]
MKQNILVIEDNDDIRDGTAELLTLAGFDVTTANCGQQAILQIQSNIPRLIICDIVMPGMDGFEILAYLRKRSRTRFIPFIFSTAKSEPVDVYKARKLGVANYLIKPFDDKELMNCINITLNGAFVVFISLFAL